MAEQKMMSRFCKLSAGVLMALLLSAGLLAQSPVGITFRGTVHDPKDTLATPAPIVVNKRTGTGRAFLPGEMFSISGLRTDTFIVTASGYEFHKFCFADSVGKDVFTQKVLLNVKINQLNPVTIYPVKDLKAIRQDRAALGVQQTRTTSGAVDALQSPLTYLYERFSQEGKSKALVAQMENQDRMNSVLKDLFRTYNQAGVINLPEAEFDNFILFLAMPESYLKTASDYDLAVTIKQRYEQYMRSRRIHNQNQR